MPSLVLPFSPRGTDRVERTFVFQMANQLPDDHPERMINYNNLCYRTLDVIHPKPSPVLTKADFYRRYRQGEFGNYSPFWETFDEWKASGCSKPVAIRVKRRGGRCDYDIDASDVLARRDSFLADGYREEELNYSAMAPHEHNVFQGEIGHGPHGVLTGFLSRAIGLPMRASLETARHYDGARLNAMLRAACDPDSFDWLHHLLDSYPGHVVEFTVFARSYGVIPRRNTVIWEVRCY